MESQVYLASLHACMPGMQSLLGMARLRSAQEERQLQMHGDIVSTGLVRLAEAGGFAWKQANMPALFLQLSG